MVITTMGPFKSNTIFMNRRPNLILFSSAKNKFIKSTADLIGASCTNNIKNGRVTS